ncbi:MAG: class I SAM-dependent methyltransferase [Firmicutes bacterium]|nr:class I SAM-dependent methyltransferase [Bacillota bacterium]
MKYTEGFNKLADIGTDHAMLPINAVLEGYVANALAIDNKEGPFVIAHSSVAKNNLSDKIKVVLSDGLEKIDDDVDVVVISGMGGVLISGILSAHPTRNVKRFVLQPNNEAHIVRKTISEIGFKIVDELIVHEGNKFYEIIVAEVGKSSYTLKELIFGPINLIEKPFYFTTKLEKELAKLESVIPHITTESRLLEIKEQIKLIQEVLM